MYAQFSAKAARHAVIQVPDITPRSPEPISLVADYLRLIVQSFRSAIADGHSEMVHQVVLVVLQHPGKITHWFQA